MEFETSRRKLEGMFLLVIDDARFGIAAAKACVGVSDTKWEKMGLQENFGARSLMKLGSTKFGNKENAN